MEHSVGYPLDTFVRLQHELHGLSPVFPASGGSKTSSESRHDQSSPKSFATLRWGRNPLPSWITPRMGIQNRCVNVLLGLNSPTPFPPDVRLLLGCLPARNGYCGYRRPNRLVDFVRATRHTPDHELLLHRSIPQTPPGTHSRHRRIWIPSPKR